MFKLQDTPTCLHSSGNKSKICAVSSYSYFSYFALILQNLRFKLYSSLNQMSGYKILPLILQLFHPSVTSFKIYCFSSGTSYLSINDFHVSCALSLHCLIIPKGMSVKLMIRKSHALDFPSYIFILSSSFSASSSVGISTYFLSYLRMPLCLDIL